MRLLDKALGIEREAILLGAVDCERMVSDDFPRPPHHRRRFKGQSSSAGQLRVGAEEGKATSLP